MKKLAFFLLLIPGFLSAAEGGKKPKKEDGFPLTIDALASEIYELNLANRALHEQLTGQNADFLKLITARCTGALTGDRTFIETLEAKVLAGLSRDVVANLTHNVAFMEAAGKQLAPHTDLADNVAAALREEGKLGDTLAAHENFMGQLIAACTRRMMGDSIFVQALSAVEHEDTTPKAQGLRRRGSSIKEHGPVALKLSQNKTFLEMVGLMLKGDGPFCEGIAEIMQKNAEFTKSQCNLEEGAAQAGVSFAKAEMLKLARDPEFVAAVAANVKKLAVSKQVAKTSSMQVAWV